MDERQIATIEVRPEALAAYSARIQSKMPGTVWMSGCASWYLDANGNNTTIWPDFSFRFRRQTRRFDASAYAQLREGATPLRDSLSNTAFTAHCRGNPLR